MNGWYAPGGRTNHVLGRPADRLRRDLPRRAADKTLPATLILATRYRGLPVLLGVLAAFVVQVVIAVAFGNALGLLPDRVVAAAVSVLFTVGAVLLLREGFGTCGEEEATDTDGEQLLLPS